MKVLVVFDHIRRDSFTGAVMDQFIRGLEEAGHTAEIADLRKEGFDPQFRLEEEPTWGEFDLVYPDDVQAEQARIERNDALAFIFPVYWWSFPATTKGWIERVWNYGWAFGNRKLTNQKALLIAVNGGTEPQYTKRGYDGAMRTQLVTGIVQYCGIEDASIDFYYGATVSDEDRAGLLERAYQSGLAF